MKITSKQMLYVSLLRDIYNGEMQLTKALPNMAKAAQAAALQDAFTEHCEETHGQADRLMQVFKMLGEKTCDETCETMKSLVEEGEEMTANTDEKTRDAGLIAIAQKVAHYEIASYNTLCRLAKELGFRDQARLLRETLDEEKGADTILTEIAESKGNYLAMVA
jgi:ferritin-like metal-binding protein YciE